MVLNARFHEKRKIFRQICRGPIFPDGRGGCASGVKEFTTLPSQNKKCPAYAMPTQF
jgi:hypothetical protein